jgi:S-adenosylmethionine hydrolase
MSRPRIVALYTDFGLADVYAGVMRGVVTTLAPEAEILDVCHAIAPGDRHEGAFMLLSTVPFLPRGTIHVCVVDPGVGTDRAIVAVRAGGHTFIAPDNGVLHPVVEALGGAAEVRTVANERLQRPKRGNTFHGRDVMAPVAAHLVRGIEFALVGDVRAGLIELPGFAPVAGPDRVDGRVLHVDRFGNVVTNLVAGDLAGGFEAGWRLRVGGTVVETWADTYGRVAPGELLAYPGSAAFLEIAVRDGSAAERIGARRGEPVAAERRIA